MLQNWTEKSFVLCYAKQPQGGSRSFMIIYHVGKVEKRR
jgi:hypothetical protein